MKLHAYITANMRKSFEWGAHDCALFAAGWIKAATGIDMLANYPSWTSEQEAAEVIALSGGLSAVMDRQFHRIEPAMAKDGDVALRKDIRTGQSGLCIFSGSHIVTTGENRLMFIDRSEAECAWSLH